VIKRKNKCRKNMQEVDWGKVTVENDSVDLFYDESKRRME